MTTDGNISNLLGMARTALMGQNNEEALTYFNRVLEIDPTVSEAWMGKGKASGWQSTLMNFRLNEVTVAFGHAIANASQEEKQATIQEAVGEFNRLAVTLYTMSRNHMVEFVSLDNSWANYLGQVSIILDSLEEVRKWSPQNVDTLENIVHLCKDNIEGYSYRDQFSNNAPCLHGITPSYEQTLRGHMDSAIASLCEIDPNYAAPAIQKKTQDACFVVTATMGDFDHPDVIYLRQFRDRWIRQQRGGETFVRAYYRMGPFFASIIGRSALLKRMSYLLIVKPATRFARRRMPR